MTIELTDKKVAVLGMGKSGIAAAKLLADKGAKVTVSELKENNGIKVTAEQLRSEGIKVELGSHDSQTLMNSELIVVSPGVSMSLPIIQELKGKVPIIGEVELAYNFISAPVIAITGTKGKTTTTTLVGEILKKAGFKVCVAGNIGLPLSSVINKANESNYVVAEISSFQLETISEFKPWISAILNVYPDHLDRYQNMQEYIEAKSNILRNQTSEGYSIFNFGNKYTPILKSIAKAQIVFFSFANSISSGVWFKDGNIITDLIGGNIETICKSSELIIKGPHNTENAMAAIAMSAISGAKKETIRDVLINFKGVEHREEFVAEINGVSFINNSQGTNVDAVAKSLESFDSSIILIAGGRKKSGNFEELKEIIKRKVKCLLLIGEAKDEMADIFNGNTLVKKVDSMEEAVKEAWASASPKDVVLLSPACSSFDMFKNYEDRGNTFKKCVSELKEKTL